MYMDVQLLGKEGLREPFSILSHPSILAPISPSASKQKASTSGFNEGNYHVGLHILSHAIISEHCEHQAAKHDPSQSNDASFFRPAQHINPAQLSQIRRVI